MAETWSAIRSFLLSTIAYTPIITPIYCNYMSIVGNVDGSPIIRSSDGTDAHSYQAQFPFSLFGTLGGSPGGGCRFSPGDIMTYIKATTGTGPVIIEFIY